MVPIHLIKGLSHEEQGNRVEFIFDDFPYIDGWDFIINIMSAKYEIQSGDKIDGIWTSWRTICYKGVDIKLVWHEDCGNFMYCKEDSEYSVACLTELANLIEKELNDFFR